MFRRTWIKLGAMFAAGLPWPAMAQQNLPRPIVLYRPPNAQAPRGSVTIPGMAASPQSPAGQTRPGAVSNPPNVGNQFFGNQATTLGWQADRTSFAAVNTPAVQADGRTQTNFASENGRPSDGTTDGPAKSQENQPMISNQMMQNPSGAYNLTHAGITTSQQFAPNLYFGSQYHTWSNLQTPTESPASFGEMSRMQPGAFGGYIAPNNYVGSNFAVWNNLSSGSVTPASGGGWSYSVWP